jgi:hypothetical protein
MRAFPQNETLPHGKAGFRGAPVQLIVFERTNNNPKLRAYNAREVFMVSAYVGESLWNDLLASVF